MPKPNTMDDWNWIDDVADKSEGTGNIYRRDLLIAAITAKLKEVDRAARIETLDWLENNASGGGDWRRKIILKRDELLLL